MKRFLLTTALCISMALTLSMSKVLADGDMVPAVSVVSPTTVVAGAAVNLEVAAQDDFGVSYCYIQIAGSAGNRATLVSGTPRQGQWRDTRTITTPGTYDTYGICVDTAGQTTLGPHVNITVTAADTVAPTVQGLTPSNATVGTPVTFSVTYSDNVGIASCSWLQNNVVVAAGIPPTAGAEQSGTASFTQTFSTAGTVTMKVNCRDAAGNEGTTTKSVVVSVADSAAPTAGIITPNSATVGVATNFGVTYSDNIGVTRCTFQGPTDVISLATLSGTATNGTANYAYTFNVVGNYSVRFVCTDAAGNSTTRSKEVIVSAASTPTGDTQAPAMGSISPGSATVGAATTFTVSYTDNIGVDFCEFQQDAGSRIVASRAGSATNGTASYTHTFSSAGNATVYFRCRDAAGNIGTQSKVVTVAAASAPVIISPPINIPSGSVPGAANIGSLMKLRCPNYAVNAAHPCKAVYYYGNDGKRHAFPNERVYATWYANFNGVVEVSDAFMASITLGRNVTYRPGIRLVKFLTAPRVYAVGRGGVLRAISTEEVARQLYGSSWSANVHDVADVFVSNYTFGADISSASQFNPTSEAALATTIDLNWQ